MKLPKADKYEFQPFGRGMMSTALTPQEALELLSSRPGVLYAVRNCVGSICGANVDGSVMSGRNYERYLNGLPTKEER